MKTLYQAQLYAPAVLFQTLMEAWGSLIDPAPRAAPSADMRQSAPPSDPAPIRVDTVIREVPQASLTGQVEPRALQIA